VSGALDLVEPLRGAVALKAAPDHFSGRHIEGGEQRRGAPGSSPGQAMADTVVAAPLRLTGTHRQQQLTAVQGLNLSLLVDAQDQRPLRRGQIEPDVGAHLVDEQRIARQLEGLGAVRLLPEGPCAWRREREGNTTRGQRKLGLGTFATGCATPAI
jgi:hypothetical protein